MNQFTNGHALIIGVGADLNVTVNDAKGIADILTDPERCAYPNKQVTLLTEISATRQRILQALDMLALYTQPESTVTFYFSGHGYEVDTGIGKQYFLMPYDYSLSNLVNTAISGQEFMQKLNGIPAKKMLVLLDCCHAGGIDSTKSATSLQFVKAPLPAEAVEMLGTGNGRVIIASCRADEVSLTGEPYSEFTMALVEAFSGYGVAQKDGYVRVADLAMYAREVVPKSTNQCQHPTLHFKESDNFIVAYYAAGDPQQKGLPKAIKRKIKSELVELTHSSSVFDQNNQSVQSRQLNVAGDATSAGNIINTGGGDVIFQHPETASIQNRQARYLKPNWQKHVVVDHDRLFGVDEILEEMSHKLALTSGAWIMGAFGDGGIGKTSIIYELITRYADEAGFTRIAWVSVRDLSSDSDGIERSQIDADNLWALLLVEIASQLEISTLTGVSKVVWETDLASELKKLAKREKCLIIVDNLEKSDDTQRVLEYFENFDIINPHKIIVTTRTSGEQFSDKILQYTIPPLGLDQTTRFVEHLGLGDRNFSALTSQDFKDIQNITDGNPYLVRLIAKTFRTNRLPIKEVLYSLKQHTSGLGKEASRYVFHSSILDLQAVVGEEVADDLFDSFCYEGILSLEKWYRYSNIKDRNIFDVARKTACDLSLIQVSDGHTKFTIHSLLREFICEC